MFQFMNPNPVNNLVGDCVIRALSLALDRDWETTFVDLAMYALRMYDMPSSNAVWGSFLHSNGFVKYAIQDTCPDCYTIAEFCRDNPQGTFVLGTGTHVVTVKDGLYLDTWDSGNEVPIYVWRKENN